MIPMDVLDFLNEAKMCAIRTGRACLDITVKDGVFKYRILIDDPKDEEH